MNRNSQIRTSGLAICLAWGLAAMAIAQDELKKQATWGQPGPQQVRETIAQIVVRKNVDELTRTKIDVLLGDANLELTADTLESVTDALALAEPRVSELVKSVSPQRSGSQKPDLKVLDDEQLDPFIRNQVSLLVGRWFAQNDFYDEANEILRLLKTDDVIDPASLLFYRALVHHRLFEKKLCLSTIDRLLENEAVLPRRFVQVSQLMLADINSMKDESLDHAARMMDDINRRISLYRSGTRVIGEEKKVIDMLDKIIEELEKQQQQQQGGSTNPSSPMQDSRIAGGKGDGQAQSKNYGEGGEWGDLPPSKRAEAMAEMAKDLPPHYREVIEEYFREIAKGNDK